MPTNLIAGALVHYGSVIKHKLWVALYLLRYWVNPAVSDHPTELLHRAIVHDLSKFRWVETKGFARTVRKLKSTKYGSDEYRALVKQIAPSISAHYERNSHHPEHYPGQGFKGMSEHDVIEMVADWCAARRRHHDGSFDESLKVNAKRFKLTVFDQKQIREIADRMGGR